MKNKIMKLKSITALMAAMLIAGQSHAGSPVGLQKVADRLILANEEGLSLYTFKPDHDGESVCYNSCAAHWPPVIVSEEVAKELTGALATTVRKDGSLQLTVDQRPVYLFQNDKNAGDILGEGLGNVWFLIDLKIKK